MNIRNRKRILKIQEKLVKISEVLNKRQIAKHLDVCETFLFYIVNSKRYPSEIFEKKVNNLYKATIKYLNDLDSIK